MTPADRIAAATERIIAAHPVAAHPVVAFHGQSGHWWINRGPRIFDWGCYPSRAEAEQARAVVAARLAAVDAQRNERRRTRRSEMVALGQGGQQ